MVGIFNNTKVFDSEDLNNKVDSIYQLLENNFGELGDKIAVCGSVAKMLDGKLDKSYTPKDVDLVIGDPLFWRFLTVNYKDIPAKSYHLESFRIIYYFDNGMLIELWKETLKPTKIGIYKNKIHYRYVD